MNRFSHEVIEQKRPGREVGWGGGFPQLTLLTNFLEWRSYFKLHINVQVNSNSRVACNNHISDFLGQIFFPRPNLKNELNFCM